MLDVATEPDNPVIGVRAFGDRPELVAEHGIAFVTGLAETGVTACAKHFPGHGGRSATATGGWRWWLPMRPWYGHRTWRLLQVPTAAVMTAHLLVLALGERPASPSSWPPTWCAAATPRPW